MLQKKVFLMKCATFSMKYYHSFSNLLLNKAGSFSLLWDFWFSLRIFIIQWLTLFIRIFVHFLESIFFLYYNLTEKFNFSNFEFHGIPIFVSLLILGEFIYSISVFYTEVNILGFETERCVYDSIPHIAEIKVCEIKIAPSCNRNWNKEGIGFLN